MQHVAGVYILPQLGLAFEMPVASGEMDPARVDKIGGKVFNQCLNPGDDKLGSEM